MGLVPEPAEFTLDSVAEAESQGGDSDPGEDLERSLIEHRVYSFPRNGSWRVDPIVFGKGVFVVVSAPSLQRFLVYEHMFVISTGLSPEQFEQLSLCIFYQPIPELAARRYSQHGAGLRIPVAAMSVYLKFRS